MTTRQRGAVIYFDSIHICRYAPVIESWNRHIFRVTGHFCGWVNNREAGDLRRYRAHCDVTVMSQCRNMLQTSIRRLGCWPWLLAGFSSHYCDVIMCAVASQITSLTIVYSTVYSDGDQRKHPSTASLAFVRGIHRGPVNSPHRWPVTRKMFPIDDVIMKSAIWAPLQYGPDTVLSLYDGLEAVLYF